MYQCGGWVIFSPSRRSNWSSEHVCLRMINLRNHIDWLSRQFRAIVYYFSQRRYECTSAPLRAQPNRNWRLARIFFFLLCSVGNVRAWNSYADLSRIMVDLGREAVGLVHSPGTWLCAGDGGRGCSMPSIPAGVRKGWHLSAFLQENEAPEGLRKRSPKKWRLNSVYSRAGFMNRFNEGMTSLQLVLNLC